jgi:general secretion pathway protein C
MLDDLGLKPGDILLEVNGIKLIDAHRGLLAYQKLRDAQEISMAVERNGVPKTMIYAISRN